MHSFDRAALDHGIVPSHAVEEARVRLNESEPLLDEPFLWDDQRTDDTRSYLDQRLGRTLYRGGVEGTKNWNQMSASSRLTDVGCCTDKESPKLKMLVFPDQEQGP